MPSSASEPSLPRRGGRRGGGADTRGDILRAARTQFANGGYEATTVRAIAREAMVDPSLIIQYFGGKDGLFQLILDEAVRPSEGIEPLTGLEPEQIGRKLAAYFFGIWEDPERRNPFQAMLVSAGENQAAAKVLRAFVREEVIARLGGLTRGADSALRAELAGSSHRQRAGEVRLSDPTTLRRAAASGHRPGRRDDSAILQ